MKISEAVRRAAKATGLSLRDLEDKTGVPPATMLRFLSGDANTRIGAVDAIADYLGIEVRLKDKPKSRRSK